MNKNLLLKWSALPIALLISQSVQANVGDLVGVDYNCGNDSGEFNCPFDFFDDGSDGWKAFANDDGTIGPGGGGQAYDTEYLFYKYNESAGKLSIGLQTGYDVRDGHWNGTSHYAGDLALSFDGNTVGADGSGYEYAVDFGLLTKNNSGQFVNDGWDNDGVDQAGLYKVSDWDNDIWKTESSPFAMDEGQLLESINSWSEYSYQNPATVGDNAFGYDFTDGVNNSGPDLSFFRVVTFDLSHIENLSQTFTVHAHWTMSCGNDAINGNFQIAQNIPVPEPSAFLLMGIGSLGLITSGIRRRKRFK